MGKNKTSFELIKSDNENSNKDDKNKKQKFSGQNEIFISLKNGNDELNKKAGFIRNKISKIFENNKDEIENNITFDIIFDTMNLSLTEYNQLSNTFDSYTKVYDDIFNEENAVQVLNILRQILSDRRSLINDLINNLIKIQKLSNDRLRLNMSMDDDSEDDVSDLMSPTSL